jgi:hypothetical protein
MLDYANGASQYFFEYYFSLRSIMFDYGENAKGRQEHTDRIALFGCGRLPGHGTALPLSDDRADNQRFARKLRAHSRTRIETVVRY